MMNDVSQALQACLIVGLTGQSGSGKTLVSGVFEKNGFSVIDCDRVSREVTTAGSACCRDLAREFPSCFDADLSLDRRKMAQIVFNDPQRLKRLNEMIFPYITNAVSEKINKYTSDGSRLILLDAPTLFESGMDRICGVIVSCVADTDVRLERIISRDGISEELARSRLGSQHTAEFFEKRSDFVIFNNGSVRQLEESAERIIKKIIPRCKGN